MTIQKNTVDSRKIDKQMCEEEGCKEIAYAIITARFLCDFHFHKIKPSKLSYRSGRGVVLSDLFRKD